MQAMMEKDDPDSDSRPPVGLMAHLPMSDKPRPLQLFGLVLCLGLLGFTTYQIVIAVQEYQNSPAVLTVSNDGKAQFPDLVFCSNVPLSYTSASYGHVEFQTEITGVLASLQGALLSPSLPPIGNLTGNSTAPEHAAMISPVIHTLGRPLLKRLFGIWAETLLFSCKLADGSDCSSAGHFEHVDSGQYLNCYRFVPRSPITGATFVLFSESLIGSSELGNKFDDGFPLSAISLSGEPEFDRSSGLALYVKHRDHYLHDIYKLMVSSGQSSLLTYTEHFDKFKSKSLNLCSESAHKVRYLLLKRVDNPNGNRSSAAADYVYEWQEFEATKSDCELRARMDYLQQRCNCRDPNFPMDQQRYRLPVCMNVSSPVYPKTSQCFQAITYANVSTQHCLEPCSRRYYGVKMSGTKWPLETNLQAMVRNMLPQRLEEVNRTYGVDIKGLGYIVSLNNQIGIPSTTVDATQLGLLSKLSGVIGSNFVKLQVRQASDKVQALKENNKDTLLDLLGNIGGLMGLYLGWSMVSLIDLLEFVHLLVRFARLRLAAKRERRNTQASRNSLEAAVQRTEQMDLRECW